LRALAASAWGRVSMSCAALRAMGRRRSLIA
jgi:hypothetical protein